MNKSETIGKWAAALADFQSKKIKVHKNKEIKGSYTYATVESILDAIQPHLASCGLAITQLTGGGPGQIKVTTVLTHKESGEFMSEEKVDDVVIPTTRDGRPLQNQGQAYASLATYYKKYGITSILGIATTDDDILDPDAQNYNDNAKSGGEHIDCSRQELISYMTAASTENDANHEIMVKALMHYGAKSIDDLTTGQLQAIISRMNKG